jgi:hypothetical protein
MSEAESNDSTKELVNQLMRTDLLVVEGLYIRHLPSAAAEDLLEIFVRLYIKAELSLHQTDLWRIAGRCWGDTGFSNTRIRPSNNIFNICSLLCSGQCQSPHADIIL